MRSIEILVALALAACSTSSGGGATNDSGASDPFVGTWDCTGTQTLNFVFEAGTMSSETSYTSATVTITDDGDGTQTSTFTTDAGATCVRKSTWSGNTATLESGQPCTFGGLTFTYTSGTSTLSGTSYMVTAALTLRGTVQYTPDGGSTEMIGVTGTGQTQSTCTKM
jgi:hypothetical protein